MLHPRYTPGEAFALNVQHVLHLDKVSDSAEAMQCLWIFWQKGFSAVGISYRHFHKNSFLRSTLLTRSSSPSVSCSCLARSCLVWLLFWGSHLDLFWSCFLAHYVPLIGGDPCKFFAPIWVVGVQAIGQNLFAALDCISFLWQLANSWPITDVLMTVRASSAHGMS